MAATIEVQVAQAVHHCLLEEFFFAARLFKLTFYVKIYEIGVRLTDRCNFVYLSTCIFGHLLEKTWNAVLYSSEVPGWMLLDLVMIPKSK